MLMTYPESSNLKHFILSAENMLVQLFSEGKIIFLVTVLKANKTMALLGEKKKRSLINSLWWIVNLAWFR